MAYTRKFRFIGSKWQLIKQNDFAFQMRPNS